jgi:hypothetical protein
VENQLGKIGRGLQATRKSTVVNFIENGKPVATLKLRTAAKIPQHETTTRLLSTPQSPARQRAGRMIATLSPD